MKSEPIPGTYVMTSYIYDSQGNRVGKGSITTLSCNKSTNGFVASAGYVTGLHGEQMTETNGTTQWVHTNVFANGSLVATYRDTNLYFSFEDWLGSKRAEGEALSNGSVCLNTYYSLPFGNALATSGGCTDATEHHFTQKERDAESGNDYFEARYYTSTFGRFISPDWTAKEEDGDPVPYAVLDDPQSLNLYAYVRNNPLVRVDADGHCCDWDSAIVGLSTFAGGLGGGLVGGAAGASAGTLVVPVFGTIAGADVGFGLGMTAGAAAGRGIGQGIVNALNSSSSNQAPASAPTSPDISHSEVKGKTPTEIDKVATDKGLQPKGPDPKAGKGSYVDPVTGEQRVLIHPDDGHAHVNNPAGERLGPDGSVVPKKSPEAHIPIKKDTP